MTTPTRTPRLFIGDLPITLTGRWRNGWRGETPDGQTFTVQPAVGGWFVMWGPGRMQFVADGAQR